jgi:hypothetical protein
MTMAGGPAFLSGDIMRKTFVSLFLAGLAATASAQTTANAPGTLRLTVDDAVRLALENNPDLKADRLDPQISDTRVAVAAGVFKPTFNTSLQRNNQLQPPAGFLIPAPTSNDVVTSNADAYGEQQLSEQLQSAAAIRPLGQRLAAARAGSVHGHRPAAARDEPHQP